MGYGYVRDDKPTQINWGEIGKQMTDSIAAEVVNRESRKAAIDTASNEYSKSLLDQPQGSNAESNRFMADFSKDASSQAKRDLDDLKSGKISERDYYKRRANLGQGTELMFKAGESFNANYDKAMERLSSGISSNEEIFDRSMMEGYLNFSSTGAYINPLTGEVNVAKRIKNNDGSGFRLSNNPGEFSNASELLRLSTAQYDKYDLQGAVVKAVEGLGKQAYKDGLGNNTTQAFNALYRDEAGKNKMQAAKASMIESFTANENHVSSILSDRLGYKYTMSAEDAAADSNLILKNPDGSKDFTTANGKKQLAAAKKEVGDLFEASLDVKITKRAELDEYQIQSLAMRERSIAAANGSQEPEFVPVRSTESTVSETIDGVISPRRATTMTVVGNLDFSDPDSDKETTEQMQSLFDNNKAFPNLTVNSLETAPIEAVTTYKTVSSPTQFRSGRLGDAIDINTERHRSFFVPELMEQKIFIPETEGQYLLKEILQTLQDADVAGKKITPTQFKSIFKEATGDDKLFDKYNAETPSSKKKMG